MYPKIFVALAILALLVPAALAGVPRTETIEYVAAGGDQYAFCTGELVEGQENLGGGCFFLDGTESTVSLVLEDATGYTVGAYYEFRDSEHNAINFGSFCETTTLDVPDGVVELRVWMDQSYVLFDCPLGNAGPATVGTITASFA